METKRLITMMLLFFAVMFGWRMYVDYLYTRHPEWRRPGETATTQPAFSTSAPAEIPGSATTAATTTGPATNSATSTSTQASTKSTMDTAALRVIPTTGSASPTAVTLGSLTDSRMVVKLSPVGAGVQSVTLPDYKAPDAKGIYTFQTPYDDADANSRAFSTRSVTVNGAKLDLVGQAWSLESSDAHSATFVIDCGLVRVRKVYQLTDKNSDGKGYELIIRHTVENKTAQPIKASIAFAGPTTPPRETERGPDLQILGGYDSGYEKIIVDHHMVEEFSVKSPTRDMTHGTDKAPLLWAGAASVYFDAIVRPEPLEANGNSPKYISNLDVAALNPESEPIDRHVVMTFTTTEMAIPAKGSISIPTTNFLGPRWRQVLNEPHYSAFPLGYDSTLVLTSGPCAYCTFEFLIKGLVKLLAFFHFIFRDWGLAIICLVLLVRGILHPITKRSQVSMMRMGKMGPEMERLKKKYADDKDELNKQTMALYKDQGVGAYLGCLPMFLQMPIWIALWSALQSTFELRQSPFLYFFGHHLTWIHDLAKPDHLVTWTPYILPSQIWVIGGAHISGFNLLPILLAVVFFLQQKYTPKPPAATPEAETQQKMMLWMSVLLFPVMLYSGPAGLNLYILTSTTIGIFESKRIREHIKQKEEEEKAGRIIVDAPKSMKKKRGDDDSNSGVKRLGAPDKPKGGIGGWIAQMQAKAEELRRAADKDRKQNCASWDEMRSDDTIAAISSAVGPAARMIVRMSGPEAHSIAAQLCSNRSTAGSAQLTTLELNKMRIPAWVYAFASPRSYTAQDLIEFHIPGNPLLAKMLLSDLLTRGARHAEAGEFTARAYFAGRIDLAEAEGVAATISAHGEAELRAARQLLSGELSRRLAPAMELLADTLALVEVGIDFSDEDVTFLSSPQVRERVARIDKLLVDLVDNSAGFERLSHEPTFVLAGRPNAGKSTLLNALAGHERAVVSDVAGTTRDILFAEAHLQRGLVRIYDVAGLGDGVAGEIDHQMTHQATLALETADFVLLVRDISDTRPQLELPRPPDLIVQSKADLAGAPPSQTEAIRVSVLNGEGMDTLREQLDRLAFGSPAGPSTLALNARHLEAIGQARVSLSRALTGIDAGFEVLAMDLRDALDALGRVLGQITPDDLLGRVFSAFCIGK